MLLETGNGKRETGNEKRETGNGKRETGNGKRALTHIVWDWNGTLLDDLHLVVDSVNASLVALGVSAIEVADYRRHFERPLHRFYERLLGHPVDDELLGVIDDVFHERYWDGYPDAGLAADAVRAVDLAVERSATQSVASMLRHDLLVPSIQRFGIDERMLAVDGHRGRVGETKEQHMVRHVQRLEVMYPDLAREHMVAIGDIVDDAVAAKAAGIDCVLYDGGGQARHALEAVGVPVAGSLTEAVELALG
jgi:phosphoglycolate phosphatase-like HAD superfamily hydrolase